MECLLHVSSNRIYFYAIAKFWLGLRLDGCWFADDAYTVGCISAFFHRFIPNYALKYISHILRIHRWNFHNQLPKTSYRSATHNTYCNEHIFMYIVISYIYLWICFSLFFFTYLCERCCDVSTYIQWNE